MIMVRNPRKFEDMLFMTAATVRVLWIIPVYLYRGNLEPYC
jgi:hypothetical protein